MSLIHSTAVIHPDAIIAPSVSIGPFTIIEDDVMIGEGTTIDSQVRIASGTRIGRNCTIHFGAVIGTNPQSITFDTSKKTYVEIGDDTELYEFITVNRGTTESYTTRIGRHCSILPYSHTAHDCQLGNYVMLCNFVQLGGHVHIGDYSILRANYPIHQFARIGRFCDKDGAVRKDIPPFIRCEHFYGSFEAVNAEKMRQEHIDEKTISDIEHAYNIIYHSGLNVSDSLLRIEQEMETTEYVQEIISFIRSSKRGIVGGMKQ